MKKTFLILVFFFVVVLVWASPYIKELRHEGLTFAMA